MNRPKNAYENWLLAAENIEANPANYCQMWFRAAKGDQKWDLMTETLMKDERNQCGTVFCRAGWLVLQTLGKKDDRGFLNITDREVNALGGWEKVPRILAQIQIWSDMDVHHDELTAAGDYQGEPGTPEYVEYGVSEIRRFAEKWREHLESVEYTYDENGQLSNYEELRARLAALDEEVLRERNSGWEEDYDEPDYEDDDEPETDDEI